MVVARKPLNASLPMLRKTWNEVYPISRTSQGENGGQSHLLLHEFKKAGEVVGKEAFPAKLFPTFFFLQRKSSLVYEKPCLDSLPNTTFVYSLTPPLEWSQLFFKNSF